MINTNLPPILHRF